MCAMQFEETLANVFEAISPASIINSEVLLSSFHHFLSRCSAKERQALFPSKQGRELKHHWETHPSSPRTHAATYAKNKAHDPKSSQIPTPSQRLAVGVSPQLLADLRSQHIPQSLGEAEHSLGAFEDNVRPDGLDLAVDGSPVCALSQDGEYSDAHACFQAKLGNRAHHAKYLVRALRGFVESKDVNAQMFTSLWSARTEIFFASGTDLYGRFRRLYDGFIRIKRYREQYDYASRLCYILLDHDLELLLKDSSLQTSRGRGKKTAAFQVQAASISSTIDAVKADCKSGRCYLQLLRCSSPGYLLLVGSHVNTLWERKLSKADIPILLDYIKEFHPEITERAQSLDAAAARLIFDGFLAYGWTALELMATQSQLLNQLRQYVNISTAVSNSHMLGSELLADLEIEWSEASSADEVATGQFMTVGSNVDAIAEAFDAEILPLPALQGERISDLAFDTLDLGDEGYIETANFVSSEPANLHSEAQYDEVTSRVFLTRDLEPPLQDIIPHGGLIMMDISLM